VSVSRPLTLGAVDIKPKTMPNTAIHPTVASGAPEIEYTFEPDGNWLDIGGTGAAETAPV